MVNGMSTVDLQDSLQAAVSHSIISRMRLNLQLLLPIVRKKVLKLHPYFMEHYNLFIKTFDDRDFIIYCNELTRNEKMQLFCSWFDTKLEEFVKSMNQEHAVKFIELPEQRQYYLITLWLEKEVKGEYRERTGKELDQSRRDETLEIEA